MIRIRGLSFKYKGGREEALKEIDLTVKRGDFLGIIGSSGAGKTTTALSCLNLLLQLC